MNFTDYEGKKVTIKSDKSEGTVHKVTHKKGTGGGLAVIFQVKDVNGKLHELMPHQLELAV